MNCFCQLLLKHHVGPHVCPGHDSILNVMYYNNYDHTHFAKHDIVSVCMSRNIWCAMKIKPKQWKQMSGFVYIVHDKKHWKWGSDHYLTVVLQPSFLIYVCDIDKLIVHVKRCFLSDRLNTVHYHFTFTDSIGSNFVFF